jgi:hypothetical protein
MTTTAWAAASVSVGIGVFEQLLPFQLAPGVAPQNSCWHWAEDPPLLSMHEARILANVSSRSNPSQLAGGVPDEHCAATGRKDAGTPVLLGFPPDSR